MMLDWCDGMDVYGNDNLESVQLAGFFLVG